MESAAFIDRDLQDGLSRAGADVNPARYRLAPGTQVREEDFGLLFYCMHGPRLFFLSSGRRLPVDFFDGNQTLQSLFGSLSGSTDVRNRAAEEIAGALTQLVVKGAIIEC